MSLDPALRRSAVGGAGARMACAYPRDYLLLCVSIGVQALILYSFWSAITVDRPDSALITTYSVTSCVLFNATLPWQFSSLVTKLKTGSVLFDLVRPLSLLEMNLWESAGLLAGRAPIILAGLLLPLSLRGVHSVLDVAWTVACAGSVLLGSLLTILIGQIISLTIVWLHDIAGVTMLYRVVSALLSGALVPLFLLPAWAQDISARTPFAAQLYQPVLLLSGAPRWDGLLSCLLNQLVWSTLAGIALGAIYRAARGSVEIYGG